MFRPTEPRTDTLFIHLWRERRLAFVQAGDGTAEILLDTFPYELLFPIELIADIIEGTTALVVTVPCNGEHLIVPFDSQIQFLRQIAAYLLERLVEFLFVVAEEADVVGVFRCFEFQNLVHIVHEVGKKKICQELRQVITEADVLNVFVRKASCRARIFASRFLS